MRDNGARIATVHEKLFAAEIAAAEAAGQAEVYIYICMLYLLTLDQAET